MIDLELKGYGYSKTLCKKITYWFIQNHLSRHHLYIQILHRSLKKECAYGYCDIMESSFKPREFLIELDTHLSKQIYTKTLLHELWHLKQWVSGELKLKASKRYFRGECIEELDYKEQPHEIDARYQERILYHQFISLT